MVTGALSPSGGLNDGNDAIAVASNAYEARMARFPENLRPGCETTSGGCSNATAGRRKEWKSTMLSSGAVVGRMVAS